MACSRCNSSDIRKDGFVNSKQRYYCKSCSYHFTVLQRKQKPINYKRLAVALHFEGLSNRAIEKILGVSDVAIMKWIRAYSNQTEKIQAGKSQIKYLNIDDLAKVITNSKKMLLVNILEKSNEFYMLK